MGCGASTASGGKRRVFLERSTPPLRDIPFPSASLRQPHPREVLIRNLGRKLLPNKLTTAEVGGQRAALPRWGAGRCWVRRSGGRGHAAPPPRPGGPPPTSASPPARSEPSSSSSSSALDGQRGSGGSRISARRPGGGGSRPCAALPASLRLSPDTAGRQLRRPPLRRLLALRPLFPARAARPVPQGGPSPSASLSLSRRSYSPEALPPPRLLFSPYLDREGLELPAGSGPQAAGGGARLAGLPPPCGLGQEAKAPPDCLGVEGFLQGWAKGGGGWYLTPQGSPCLRSHPIPFHPTTLPSLASGL